MIYTHTWSLAADKCLSMGWWPNDFNEWTNDLDLSLCSSCNSATADPNLEIKKNHLNIVTSMKSISRADPRAESWVGGGAESLFLVLNQLNNINKKTGITWVHHIGI